MLLMIDDYDSFTFNIVQYFGELGEDVRVFRNDGITLDEIEALAPRRLVISPGPCSPRRPGYRSPPSGILPGRFRSWASVWGTSPSARPSAARWSAVPP